MFGKGLLHFTFVTQQPNALCKPALLHTLPGPRPSSAGHTSRAHRKDSAQEHCPISGSLLPPPEVSQRGFACVCVQAALLHSMYPLSQAPFKSKAIQTGQQTLGRFITRLGGSWPAASLLSPSPSFLTVRVACGAGLSGSPPPRLPVGGGAGGQDSSRP